MNKVQIKRQAETCLKGEKADKAIEEVLNK